MSSQSHVIPIKRAKKARQDDVRVCETGLVQRFAGGMLEPFNRVLNHQFAAL
jgi:hypothetical protein